MTNKKVTRVVKIQVRAGEANPANVGKDLGPLGINIMEFCKGFNAETQDRRGHVIPAVITVFEDRSFTFVVKMPTTASLLKQAAGIEKGSARVGSQQAAAITREQLREVARTKLPDLNTTDLDQAEKIIAGTARSMGITIKD
ncbi:50S ribosomal protein L11 [Bailinhaonella thermotolerans]|uniref:Large ribosomal subunit protein uL11 n=1 Tax=Bailinhaonella thermotolerans TaxID=1070861 RepID=A0A3A4A3D6_9ACTN|nr:50S ribosomal protein L11 [Bailinhaonella thermotolerans]RJL22112.1 50S ribosomal protein L11 [Bailinhaonella thermotolerans]